MPRKEKKHLFEADSGSDDAEKEGSEEWITSYGDMMTLLLTFFILLFAISTIDPVKMQQVTQQMREAIGGERDVPVQTLREVEEEIETTVINQRMEQMVELQRDKDGVQLILKGESFFPSGSAALYTDTFPFLDQIVRDLMESPYNLSIEGHTDNIPISGGIYPTNWELSGARAAAVARYFESKGVVHNRLRIVGWADVKPMDPLVGNSTPEARSRNRRVVITVLNEFNQDIVQEDYQPSQDVRRRWVP